MLRWHSKEIYTNSCENNCIYKKIQTFSFFLYKRDTALQERRRNCVRGPRREGNQIKFSEAELHLLNGNERLCLEQELHIFKEWCSFHMASKSCQLVSKHEPRNIWSES